MIFPNRDLFFTFECAGGQSFKVIEFSFDEGVSILFSGQIKLTSDSFAKVRADEMVDKEATLKIFSNGENIRVFSGIVKAFTGR